MAQEVYAQVAAKIDRAEARFNQQSSKATHWTLGGLICFGFGLVTGNKGMMALGLGVAGLGEAHRLDTRGHLRTDLAGLNDEMGAIKRDEFRMQRVIRKALPGQTF